MSGNDNEPTGMVCEVIEVRDAPGEFLVEAIDHGSEGEIYRAIFDGPLARERALLYAAREYGHNGILMSQPTHKWTQRPRPKLTLVSTRDIETTGYAVPTDERGPARTTGEWRDVWSRLPAENNASSPSDEGASASAPTPDEP